MRRLRIVNFKLKGLEFEDFKKQINYFKNFNIISHSDLVEILNTKKFQKKNLFY